MPCPAAERAAVLLIETDSISVIGPSHNQLLSSPVNGTLFDPLFVTLGPESQPAPSA
jgi:hypothetical protein